jgi:hypothetical protein
MQIHEITTGIKTPLSEGLFDTLKAAATWEPGESFAQARAKVKNDAGVAAVAKKAQAAWQSYEQQLQKSVSQQPAGEEGEATKPATPGAPAAGAAAFGQMANTLTKDPAAANTMAKPENPNASPETPAAGTTYDPAKSAADKQAKNQADQQLATQQMKATADANAAKSKEDDEIKAAAAAARAKPGFQQTAADKLALKTAANKGIKEAQDTASPLDAYRNRTDGRYQQALKAFVQQNLLAGMPYARLQNAQEIDRLIKTISQPQNAAPQAQTPLWQQLALATAVAAVVPQSAGGAGPEPTGGQTPDDTAQLQSAQELIEPVRQAMQQSQIDLAKPGQVLRSKFNNNETAIRSTGNPNVDAMLLAMGFTI